MKAKLYTIEKFGAFGEGVARDDGKTVFIKGALPDEKVLASVTLDKKTFSVARLKKVLAPSEFRIVPPCKYFGVCGGCSLQHLDYSEQLRLKAKTVQETLFKVGGIEIEPPEIVASDKIYGYRNKLSYPVSGEKIGLYAENSHDIVDLDNCLLQREWNVSLISALRKFMSDYPEVKDEIRHMVAREKDGGVCVALVAYKKINIKPFADYLPFGDFALYLNVNASRNNVILSDEFYLADTKGNAPKFHPASFYQVNDFIAERLYGDVLAEVDGDVIVDAYCGAGDLTIRLSAAAKRTIGVEICAQAVQEARQKAKAKQITNAEFICGDCKKILPEIFNNIDGEITVVFDPPRKGLDPDIISSVKTLSPEKIIYISCNPSTLARDLKLLSDHYDIANLILYDMFPNTPHVETLVVLSHKKPDGHIGVKVEFGEEEGQISLKEVEKRAEERKPKEKVTYKMIQEYIEKTYGFKVHTAYIAEVKRSLGLPMYDAPNAVEELKRPRSHPSPQPVEAIKETLKHFEII